MISRGVITAAQARGFLWLCAGFGLLAYALTNCG